MTLSLLYAGDWIGKYIVRQRMAAYAAGSARASDGAANHVVMDGYSGFIGVTGVHLQYLKDGYIRVSGSNPSSYNGWKVLSEFTLEPGTYTLSGFSGLEKNTVALQLRLSDHVEPDRRVYQWDGDVTFTLRRAADAFLTVRVYPLTEIIDAVARPAVYRDD